MSTIWIHTYMFPAFRSKNQTQPWFKNLIQPRLKIRVKFFFEESKYSVSGIQINARHLKLSSSLDSPIWFPIRDSCCARDSNRMLHFVMIIKQAKFIAPLKSVNTTYLLFHSTVTIRKLDLSSFWCPNGQPFEEWTHIRSLVSSFWMVWTSLDCLYKKL